MGVGGGGKSTVAAALAYGLRREGRNPVLVSIDGSDPSDLVEGCDVPVRRIDPLAVLENRYRSLAAVMALSGQHDHQAGPTLPDPEELTRLPAAEPLTALMEVIALADSGEADHVVVDCPGPAGWYELISMPDTIVGYLERIWPRHARVVASTGSDVRASVLVEVVDRITDAASSAARVLGDADRVVAVAVTTAARRALAETTDLLAVTSFHGVRVERVIASRVVPDLGGAVPTSVLGAHPAVYWMDRARAEQWAALDDFARAAGDLRIDVTSAQSAEPVGSWALGAVADQVSSGADGTYGHCDLPALSPRVRHESGAGADSVYVMEIPLPFVDTDTVAVGRVEDDVIVSAQGSRRRLRLASVLRRCVVTGARVDDAVLTVTFAPDPALWPENLGTGADDG